MTKRHLRKEARALAKELIVYAWAKAHGPDAPLPRADILHKAIRKCCWRDRKYLNEELRKRKAFARDFTFI